jgi:hypothetical protein
MARQFRRKLPGLKSSQEAAGVDRPVQTVNPPRGGLKGSPRHEDHWRQFISSTLKRR